MLSIELNSKTIEKFIDVVSKGIGTFWEPIQLKRIAKAQDKVKSIELEYQNKLLELIKNESTTSHERSLFERALITGLGQSIKNQENIETILHYAYEDIKGKSCNDEAVSQTWLNYYFNNAKYISEQDAQLLWAKILSTEIQRPNSISLRTVEILKCLSMEEAELFMKIVSVAYKDRLPSRNHYNKMGISYFDLLKISEIGLIIVQPVPYRWVLKKDVKYRAKYKHYSLILKAKTEFTINSVYAITTAGQEIIKANEIHDKDKCIEIWKDIIAENGEINVINDKT